MRNLEVNAGGEVNAVVGSRLQLVERPWDPGKVFLV